MLLVRLYLLKVLQDKILPVWIEERCGLLLDVYKRQVLHLCEQFFHTCRVPADAAYLLDDELLVVQNEVHIGLFAGGEVQLYGCLHFGEQGSVVAASGRSIYFASNVEAMHTQCIIETFQYT